MCDCSQVRILILYRVAELELVCGHVVAEGASGTRFSVCPLNSGFSESGFVHTAPRKQQIAANADVESYQAFPCFPVEREMQGCDTVAAATEPRYLQTWRLASTSHAV